MNPTPPAIEIIRARVTDWAAADAAIADALNAAALQNPAPAAQVPAPLAVMSVLGSLSKSSLDKVDGALTITIRDAIRAQDRETFASWVGYCTLRELITGPESATLTGFIAATHADPAYQPLLSWAQLHLGRPVDADDIAASRPVDADDIAASSPL